MICPVVVFLLLLLFFGWPRRPTFCAIELKMWRHGEDGNAQGGYCGVLYREEERWMVLCSSIRLVELLLVFFSPSSLFIIHTLLFCYQCTGKIGTCNRKYCRFSWIICNFKNLGSVWGQQIVTNRRNTFLLAMNSKIWWTSFCFVS